ncbi:hypothetical protein [Streptomyces sp. NPDC059816]|uniref:hypothetical protein n=1 Tax=Streptomyces sp. NPDC059816 TaxID=3346960 RepID=UPI003655B9A8
MASAEFTTQLTDGSTLRADENALRLLVVARSPDPARSTLAPSETWIGVGGPHCEARSCTSPIARTTDYYPASGVDEAGQGRGEGVSWGGTLKGGTDYYVTWEAVVNVKAKWDDAQLCVLPEVKPCIPLGEVTKANGVR